MMRIYVLSHFKTKYQRSVDWFGDEHHQLKYLYNTNKINYIFFKEKSSDVTNLLLYVAATYCVEVDLNNNAMNLINHALTSELLIKHIDRKKLLDFNSFFHHCLRAREKQKGAIERLYQFKNGSSIKQIKDYVTDIYYALRLSDVRFKNTYGRKLMISKNGHSKDHHYDIFCHLRFNKINNAFQQENLDKILNLVIYMAEEAYTCIDDKVAFHLLNLALNSSLVRKNNSLSSCFFSKFSDTSHMKLTKEIEWLKWCVQCDADGYSYKYK